MELKILKLKILKLLLEFFFNQRRKKIKKPLNQLFKKSDKIIEKLNLNTELRPQNLSPETYYKLAKEYEVLRN